MVSNNSINAQNAQYNLIVGTGSAYTNIAPNATAGVPLVSNGSSANPSFGTANVAGGGTGVTSATAYAVICAGTTSTSSFQPLASLGTSGYVLTSNGAGALPTWQAAGGGGITWTEVTGTSQSAAVNNGYIANNASLVTITLPATAALGSTVRVVGNGAGLWKLLANTGQTIHFGNTNSTVAGYVSSSQRYDCIEVLCTVANTEWTVSNGPMGGNFTVA